MAEHQRSKKEIYQDMQNLMEELAAMEPEQKAFSLAPLVDVIATLRSPGGCPWDIVQTHSSLRRYLVEEVYEVLEAIDKQDMANLREELGDLLLQIVFHARIAEEAGLFTVQDVVDDITQKMVRRHPHVFHTAGKTALAKALPSWEELKRQEKDKAKRSVLGGVSKGLPALLRAQKLQEKAAKVGFDWDTEEPIWAKFYEEVEEFKEAILAKNEKNMELEAGDVLFSLINLMRWYKISGENALNRVNNKFQHRFSYVEAQVEASGRDWHHFSLNELDRFWDEAKVQENGRSF